MPTEILPIVLAVKIRDGKLHSATLLFIERRLSTAIFFSTLIKTQFHILGIIVISRSVQR